MVRSIVLIINLKVSVWRPCSIHIYINCGKIAFYTVPVVVDQSEKKNCKNLTGNRI